MALRGLARSRTRAQRLIDAGMVLVDGLTVLKPSLAVSADAVITVTQKDEYVSRGALKLVAALNAFDVDVSDRVALDVGASTGGFTQVLLEQGARRVLAVDVGHRQLDTAIEANPAVVSIEGFNIRNISPQWLRAELGSDNRPDLVVADLSFISLGVVLPVLVESIGRPADYIILIKPQFEVGRSKIGDGVVRDSRLRHEAVMNVLKSAWDLGLGTAGVISSPIVGTAGNHEYLVWLNGGEGLDPTEWVKHVSALTIEA